MAVSLQKTKLFLPTARAKLVRRPRLLARLDGLLEDASRLGLVCAPAGSGKTTLVVQWLQAQGIPTAWVSLDARDNAPARFFAYLIAALQPIVSGAGREALPLLDLPGLQPEEVVTLLTNDLLQAPGPFLLVLDDFHTVTNPLLHQAVDFLVEAQPPQMRLALLSREDPVLHLARFRARGQLVELRQADLSFTLPEAAAFVQHSMNLALTLDQVQALEARTEGWIAGLQMASLVLQGPPEPGATADVERFLQNFSGTHRYILDYLMEEVLASQPPEVQTFLLETSILERMHPEMCAAVTGKTVAETRRLLERVARANLFVIPLEEDEAAGAGWFRYHHLFGDLLLAHLRSTGPARAAILERRASDWFEANGEPRLAVEYALRAQDAARAADLVEQHIRARWQTVDIEFLKLVQRLPQDVVAERPTLCLQNAWLSVLFGQTGHILPFVQAAERAIAHTPDPHAAANLAFARTLRAYVDDLGNRPVEMDGSFAVAYAAIPEENPGMRNSVGVVIGMLYFMEGEFDTALRYYEEAIVLDHRMNGTNAVPIATTRICQVLQAQGRLREAVRRLCQSEDYVRERGIRRFYISGALAIRTAEILLEWNRLEEAEMRLQEGLRLMEDWPMPPVRSMGQTLLARVRTAQGRYAEAQAALALVDATRRQTDLHPTFLDALERARMDLFLSMGDRETLEDWVGQHRHLADLPLHFRYEARRIELCRAWLALGQVTEAAALLTRLAEAAGERAGSRARILPLMAALTLAPPTLAPPVLAGAEPSLGRVLEVVEEALRLAEAEGYRRVFIDAGEPVVQALRLWLQQGVSKDDLRLRGCALAILAACTGSAAPEVGAQPPGSSERLPEPLSPREQEVLLLVARGLTNQQIATRLVISVRTVKKHVENIHGKLAAHSRTHAVMRARELGLLP
jgi:LuxR family maltose regulon positive regulatory protein